MVRVRNIVQLASPCCAPRRLGDAVQAIAIAPSQRIGRRRRWCRWRRFPGSSAAESSRGGVLSSEPVCSVGDGSELTAAGSSEGAESDPAGGGSFGDGGVEPPGAALSGGTACDSGGVCSTEFVWPDPSVNPWSPGACSPEPAEAISRLAFRVIRIGVAYTAFFITSRRVVPGSDMNFPPYGNV